jgi:hypothetical protein
MDNEVKCIGACAELDEQASSIERTGLDNGSKTIAHSVFLTGATVFHTLELIYGELAALRKLLEKKGGDNAAVS